MCSHLFFLRFSHLDFIVVRLWLLYNACVDFANEGCSLFDPITMNPVIGLQMTKANP